MTMTLLGTGTSHGVPVIACNCAVCTSSDEKDKRMRSSALLEYEASAFLPYIHQEIEVEAEKESEADSAEFGGEKGNVAAKSGRKYYFLIDIGPEFRLQALRARIKSLDAVFITHSHADHLHGLDDIRPFSNTSSPSSLPMPVFSNDTALSDIRERFSYIFKDTQLGGGKPKIVLTPLSELKKFEKIGLFITPIDMMHGELHATGYAFASRGTDGLTHAMVYLTDCNKIEASSILKIRRSADRIDFLVIDGLRERPHSTHFCFLQALDAADKIGAAHTYLTHLTHNKSHCEVNAYIAKHLAEFTCLKKIVASGGSVEAAYDLLVLRTS